MRKNYYAKKPQCAWIPFSVYLYPVLFLSLIKRISIFKKKNKKPSKLRKRNCKNSPQINTPLVSIKRNCIGIIWY